MALARGRSVTIGVLSEDVDNGYSELILDELSKAAHEHGVRLINFVEWLVAADVRGSRRLTTDLARASCLDGLLVLPLGYSLTAEDLAEYCERFRPLPICAIPELAADWCSQVVVDNEPGMRQGMEHLVKTHGYRRVAFIRGPEHSKEANVRFRIYREVLEENGIAFDPNLVAPGHYDRQSGTDAVALFIDERKLMPEAIACANDGMAMGVLDALVARGISSPAQIALVGYDDIEFTRYVDPPLTTVRQPLRKLGRAALDVLLRQLEPGQLPERQVLPSELVVRQSCGCLAYRDTRSAKLDSMPVADAAGLPELGRGARQSIAAMEALGLSGLPETGWAAALFQAFASDLTNSDNAFLPELRGLVHAIGRERGETGACHKLITVLWRRARQTLLPNSAEWRRADILLHAARVTVSGAAEGVRSRHQLRIEDFSRKLFRTSNTLGLAVDVASVNAALATDLRLYEVPACFVCLYDSEEGPLETCRLIVAFDSDRALDVPPAGIRFRADLLLPDGISETEEPRQYIIGPLRRSGNSAGYVVFVRGPHEGFVYENLMAQIGGAVDRISLLERLVTEAARHQQAERERLERELAIATRIQTGILPGSVDVEGLEVSATMLPATEVGGDYYDVIPVAGGCWIGIGDVAGHGLPTGLVMLMLQSVLSGLVRTRPEAPPREILPVVNSVLFENIRERMGQDEYVTLTLLHYRNDGQLTFAGAHEDILIYRAEERRIEWIRTPGTWLAAVRNISLATVDSTCKLERGDLVVLYTDGATEAMNAHGEMFGIERLADVVASVSSEPVEVIRDALIRAVEGWMSAQEDDITLFVMRHVGV